MVDEFLGHTTTMSWADELGLLSVPICGVGLALTAMGLADAVVGFTFAVAVSFLVPTFWQLWVDAIRPIRVRCDSCTGEHLDNSDLTALR